MLSRVNTRQNNIDAAARSSQSKAVGEAPAADAMCSGQDNPSNSAKEMAEPRDVPVRRRGPAYSWTIGDHLALMTSSVLLMVRCSQLSGMVLAFLRTAMKW